MNQNICVCFDFDYAHFMIGVDFFGVLYNLLGVRGLDTGVVLGATFTFFGVAIRLGDGDFVVVAVVALRKKRKQMYSDFHWMAKKAS